MRDAALAPWIRIAVAEPGVPTSENKQAPESFMLSEASQTAAKLQRGSI
jgi:hypothetical protein